MSPYLGVFFEVLAVLAGVAVGGFLCFVAYVAGLLLIVWFDEK